MNIEKLSSIFVDSAWKGTSSATPQYTVNSKPTLRSRTFLEKQPYIVAYGGVISAFSPIATAYQLCKLYNLRPSSPTLLRMSLGIFPHQTALKALQMNVSTPVKEYLNNPWAAFGVVGILQGGVYGQANVHFSRALQLGQTAASLRGIFRGSAFAGLRDTISQGMPFMCSESVRTQVLERAWQRSEDDDDDLLASSVQHWTAVVSTSVVATYASQGLHNCQTAMQADQSLSYRQAVRTVFQQHGWRALIKGAEARVGLLLIVNVLNELLLKPAWAPVEA